MQRGGACIAAALATALALWWTIRAGPRTSPAAPPERVPEPPAATGELRVVRLAGGPFERGRSHGEQLREEIRRWLDATLPADEGLRDFAVRTCGERLLPALPDSLRRELEGLAEGAGIDILEALFLNTRLELAAYGLQRDRSDAALQGEGAVGPGPEAVRRFEARDPGWTAGDVVVFVHDGIDPPLVLVGLPGMLGGFLGARGEAAAAAAPVHGPAQPVLTELPGPLLLRRLLEDPPARDALAALTAGRAMAVAWRRADGTAGELSLAPDGAAWRAAPDGFALTAEVDAGGGPGAGDEATAARRAARARDLLGAPRAPTGWLLRLRAEPGGWLAEASGAGVLLRARLRRG